MPQFFVVIAAIELFDIGQGRRWVSEMELAVKAVSK
jgi:hypothetical protein